jgi:hypothetical protein
MMMMIIDDWGVFVLGGCICCSALWGKWDGVGRLEWIWIWHTP